MTTALDRINAMSLRHYQDSADWQRGQAYALGDVLWDLIKILRPPNIGSVDAELAEGDALLFGLYRVSDVLESARSAVAVRLQSDASSVETPD